MKQRVTGGRIQDLYGKAQYINNLPTINMRLLGGHCFCNKKMDVLCKGWGVKDVKNGVLRMLRSWANIYAKRALDSIS